MRLWLWLSQLFAVLTYWPLATICAWWRYRATHLLLFEIRKSLSLPANWSIQINGFIIWLLAYELADKTNCNYTNEIQGSHKTMISLAHDTHYSTTHKRCLSIYFPIICCCCFKCIFDFIIAGATNVGSVDVYIDEQLKTNRWHGFKVGKHNSANHFDEIELPENVKLSKGQLLGQFNMGSTVVLIFEAPKNFKWVDDHIYDKINIQPILRMVFS